MNVDGKTLIYGIIGNPVSHSLSPAMHNAAFRECEQNRIYLPFNVEDVESAMIGLRGLNVHGASVTIPHKEEVMKYLDEIDSVAKRIGAVNTIIVRQQGSEKKLCGSNTDWIGANRALGQRIDPKGKSIVILGAGGSARAIGFGLLEVGANICLCSRTQARGEALAKDLNCSWLPLDNVSTLTADVLINATSVGMSPQEGVSPVSEKAVQNFQVIMDIVYAPLATQLLKDAEKSSISTINGLEMLLYQGVAQFELWTGQQAPVEIMRKELYRQTGNN